MGSSAEGARLVVFWGEQRNWGGGAAALRAERAGGRGMNHTDCLTQSAKGYTSRGGILSGFPNYPHHLILNNLELSD